MSGIDARFLLTRAGFSLDVDLHLPGRGVTALFGVSGSGKTTLLRCIAGLERAEGELRVNGAPWQDANHNLPTHRRPIGYVFQDTALFPHLSVHDNLQFGLKRVPPAARRIAPDEVVDLLGIGHLMERRPDRLSGGEQQRVAIARALATSPQLLLMDEPLAALDAARKREILPYLERLHETLSIPVFYVSHAVEEVMRLADHLVLMDNGRVLAAGTFRELASRHDLPFQRDDEAGVVLEARIAERDGRWQLARAAFADGSLWVRDAGLPLGKPLRVRVLARDVSIALAAHHDTSIANVLPVTVESLVADHHPAQVLVRLRAGNTPLLARVTARSADALGLVPGRAVFAQVKSVAVIE
ncbi:MAG: molybdenum ABC transporter ATP-binding protein [Gammaproteobacteria bacterium]